jgi:hypothetical protein
VRCSLQRASSFVRSVKPPPSSAQSGVTHGGRISNPVQAFLYRYNLGYNQNPPPGSYKLPYHLPESSRLHKPIYGKKIAEKTLLFFLVTWPDARPQRRHHRHHHLPPDSTPDQPVHLVPSAESSSQTRSRSPNSRRPPTPDPNPP